MKIYGSDSERRALEAFRTVTKGSQLRRSVHAATVQATREADLERALYWPISQILTLFPPC